MARYTRDQWLTFFSDHQASGLTAADFCRQNSLNAKYFSLRKHQLLKSPTTKSPSNKFVAATVVSSTAVPITIRYQSTEVYFPSSLSPQWLASFVRALA